MNLRYTAVDQEDTIVGIYNVVNGAWVVRKMFFRAAKLGDEGVRSLTSDQVMAVGKIEVIVHHAKCKPVPVKKTKTTEHPELAKVLDETANSGHRLAETETTTAVTFDEKQLKKGKKLVCCAG
ncbi:Hypothetical protein D9617_4g000610 [Elsinoe fawcettii]|nr:Hypothetical protein D9617_4g000610 [Elsinoe fawcettii]